MSLPQSYHVQDGCHNCGHVFVRAEYEEGYSYYCTLNAPPRPLCFSVEMNEALIDVRMPDREYLAKRDAWYVWAAAQRVDAWGKCDEWKPWKEAEG